MKSPSSLAVGLGLGFVLGLVRLSVHSSQKVKDGKKPAVPFDAVTDAQEPREVPADRPEQKLSKHDKSDVFEPPTAPSSSPALEKQPEKGRMTGFDFRRDPLGAK